MWRFSVVSLVDAEDLKAHFGPTFGEVLPVVE
jgi:hypothetical protein